MNIQNKFNLNGFSTFLKILIIVALIAGIILRFYNLDGKLYSNDETFSTTYIFGRDLGTGGLIDNRIVTVEELQNYQRVNSEESLPQSISRLINQPYVFPPLYAILMQIWSRLWMDYSGSPAVVTRSLTALISLFAFIGMYWLCWELTGSKIFAWIGTVLIAISPFHLQYAQIVRTYSLTTVAILLSSAALLRAMRLNTKPSWLVYTASLAFGLYSNLLFGFLAIAHGVYVLVREKFRLTKTFKLYLLASIIGGSIFLPWFILFITKSGLFGYSVSQPVKRNLPFITLLRAWIRQIIPIFIDLNNPWREFTRNFQILQKILSPFVLLLVLVSLYWICRYSPKAIRIFILCLLAFGGVFLMAKDALLGGSFSVRLRYMLPYVIAIQIAVAYYLAIQIESSYSWRKKMSELILIVLIIGGILSCGIIGKANSWSAFGAPEYSDIAQKINQEKRPVILFEDWGDALTMSYMLKAKTSAHLTRRGAFYLTDQQGNYYEQFSDIIIFKPSKDFVEQIQKNPQIKLKSLLKENQKSEQYNVWKVEKQ